MAKRLNRKRFTADKAPAAPGALLAGFGAQNRAAAIGLSAAGEDGPAVARSGG